ncbi:hypothetical protein [Achromobacter sp. DMS1]|uniref:hypothetical protein n=1 Tax=Achromobacter sp. DMS1 TaxID=1688405 RepID=UPI000A445DC7|nr:hypothetical protein [Achromobacter sp. DMS1]
MSRSVSAVIACALSAFAIAAPAQARDYQIDPEHTEVVVSWSHFGFSRPTAHAGASRACCATTRRAGRLSARCACPWKA